MASIHQEIVIAAEPAQVWAAVRDVGAVHRRLVPGQAVDTRLDGDTTILTFPSGGVVRDLIVAVDEAARQLAYAVVEGRLPLVHHHASFHGHETDAGGSRRARRADYTALLMSDACCACARRCRPLRGHVPHHGPVIRHHDPIGEAEPGCGPASYVSVPFWPGSNVN